MTVMHLRKSLPFGLLMAVVVGIIIGISFGTVMLVSVFVYRRRLRTGRCNVQVPIVGYGLTSERSGRPRHGHDDCCKSNADNIQFQLMYSGSSGIHPNEAAGGTGGSCVHTGGVNFPASTNAENILPDYVSYFRSPLCHSSSSDNIEREDGKNYDQVDETGQHQHVIDPPLYNKTSCRIESLPQLSTPMTSASIVDKHRQTISRTHLPDDVVMTSPVACNFTRTMNRGRNSVDHLTPTYFCPSRRNIRFNEDWMVKPGGDQCYDYDYCRPAINPEAEERRMIIIGGCPSTSELQLLSLPRNGSPRCDVIDVTSGDALRMVRNFRSRDLLASENHSDQVTACDFLENQQCQQTVMSANPDGGCGIAGQRSVNADSSCRPDVVTSPTNDHTLE